ncbi:hypothetical protein V5O48_006798 [Marasmius crinis-equi]|uniref:Uncharacterized protein n=1 Tax=Marasmius crinis-equi TaxID=585013 RepID=A0ABR3FIJ9_9AGAR
MYVPSLARAEAPPSRTTPKVIPNTSGQTPFVVCMIDGTFVEALGYVHIVIAAYRLTEVWIVGANLAPPLAGLTTLNTWDNGLWVAGYVTQELLGTGAAIYRCWLLWDKSWRVIVIPAILLLAEIATGYASCAMLASSDPLRGKLDPLLQYMMQTFYALAVIGNMIPTGLMVYRLWSTHRKFSNSAIATPSILYPVLRILVESASLQLIVEVILLGLFDSGRQEQFIVLPLIVPVIGITFSLITIRIKLVASKGRDQPSYLGNDSERQSKNQQQQPEQHQLRTIGSLPSSPRRGNFYATPEMNGEDSVMDIRAGQ